MLKKNNHTHKTIFMRFGNLPTFTELQGFHYYQEKIQSVAIQFFSLKKKLNCKKSPIKNHATLFWARSSTGSNTTRLHKT